MLSTLNSNRRHLSNVPFMNTTNRNRATSPSSSSSTPTKKRGANISWKKFKVTTNPDDVKIDEKTWAFAYKTTSKEGRSIVYRCAKSRQKLSRKRAIEKDQKSKAKKQKATNEYDTFDDVNYNTQEFNKFINRQDFNQDDSWNSNAENVSDKVVEDEEEDVVQEDPCPVKMKLLFHASS